MKKLPVALITLNLAFNAVFYPVARAEEIARVDEIVVQETQEAKALRERKESVAAKTVITRKEITELGGQTAADVLRRLPGLYFSGPPTVNKDIRMAGLDKEFQNVLINGNRPPGGGEKREFALDRIPVDMIDRIELLKSPTAAHDSDAVAGVVNIVLKEPGSPRPAEFSAGVSANSWADRLGSKLYLDFSGKAGTGLYLLEAVRADEYRGKGKETVDTGKNEKGSETERTRVINTSFSPTLSYRNGADGKFTLRPFWLEQKEIKNLDKPLWTLAGTAKSRNIDNEDKTQTLRGFNID